MTLTGQREKHFMLLELPQSLLNVTVELAVDFGAAQADVNTNEAL